MGIVNFALYVLAVLTSVTCMVFLFRGYSQTGVRLLLWSGLCFVGLSLNNVLLFFDVVVYPDPAILDLRAWRLVAALTGMLFLLYGFIWESE